MWQLFFVCNPTTAKNVYLNYGHDLQTIQQRQFEMRDEVVDLTGLAAVTRFHQRVVSKLDFNSLF